MPTVVIEQGPPLDTHVDTDSVAQNTAGLPEEVFGINTVALLRFSEVAADSTLVPPHFDSAIRSIPQAIRLVPLVPLVEQMQASGEVRTEDVAPYRETLRDVAPRLRTAENLALKLGGFAVNALDRKVNRELSSQTNDMAEKARIKIGAIEEDVRHIAHFENPKEQFVTEVNTLSREVRSSIAEQRDLRVEGKVKQKEASLGGIKGFVAKVVHKVRSFFRSLFGGSRKKHEITAYDAGAGIEKTLKDFAQNPEATQKKFPLLSRYVPKLLTTAAAYNREHFSFVAPEILSFLTSVTNEDDDDELLDSVRRNPHDLRFITTFKSSHKRFKLENIQQASINLLPALRDVLPASGAQVSEIFKRVQGFAQGKKVLPHVDNAGEKPELFKRFLAKFRKSEKKKSKEQVD